MNNKFKIGDYVKVRSALVRNAEELLWLINDKFKIRRINNFNNTIYYDADSDNNNTICYYTEDCLYRVLSIKEKFKRVLDL